jgi:hypothetical protein
MDARSKRLAAAKQKLQVYKLQHQMQHQQHEQHQQSQQYEQHNQHQQLEQHNQLHQQLEQHHQLHQQHEQHQVADHTNTQPIIPSHFTNQSNSDRHTTPPPLEMTMVTDDVNAKMYPNLNSQEVYPVPVFNQFQEPEVNSPVLLLANGSNGLPELELQPQPQPVPTSNGYEPVAREEKSQDFQSQELAQGDNTNIQPADIPATTHTEHQYQQQQENQSQEDTNETMKSSHQDEAAAPPTSSYQNYVPVSAYSEQPEPAHYLESNPNRYFAGQYDYEEFNGQRNHSHAHDHSHSHSEQMHPFQFSHTMAPEPDPAFELELTQLRQDNSHLQRRESELISQLQSAEKVIDDLSREREKLAVELRSELDPLRGRVGDLFNENESLRAKLREVEKKAQEEKQKQEAKFLEMEAAFIHVSTGKMDLAERLDAQTELVKSMGDEMKEKDKRIEELENENKELAKSVYELNTTLDAYAAGNTSVDHHGHELTPASTEQSRSGDDHHVHGESCEHGHTHTHHAAEKTTEESPDSHSHSHHDHDHSHSHSHNHNEHEHHDHDHDHDHDHTHSHSHDDHSGHSHSHPGSHAGEEHDHSHGSSPTPSALEKKLLRLQWENSTYQEELDKLSSILKTKTADASTVATYKEENESLKAELGRLEHLVIQLQGENDTIGDYITLYQSQRLALKEKALQKEKEMDNLVKEREHLRLQTEELGRLIKSCTHDEGGSTELPVQKIKELLNHGGLNYHPCCGLCSGRLMDV